MTARPPSIGPGRNAVLARIEQTLRELQAAAERENEAMLAYLIAIAADEAREAQAKQRS